MGYRKITVDGTSYRFRVGQYMTLIRDAKNKAFAKVFNFNMLGVSPETFEKGQWKRTRDGMVTPALVARAIRRTLGKPQFEHDCTKCVFLGQDERHDYYFCDGDIGGGTLIARFGSKGSEYLSGNPECARANIQKGVVLFEAGKERWVPGYHPMVLSYPLVKALQLKESKIEMLIDLGSNRRKTP